MADDRKFVRTLQLFGKITNQRVAVVKRKVAFDAFNGVLRRSPVDTGRFRWSWRIAVGDPDLSVEPPDKKKSGVQKGTPPTGKEVEQLGKLKQVTAQGSVHISNNLPYAERLENGYSTQAPTGILEPTLSEMLVNFNTAVQAVKKEVPDA